MASKYLSLLSKIDTSIIADSEFIEYLSKREGWYPVYQFAKNVGENYTLFEQDTVLTIDSTEYPIRIKFFGNRKNDEDLPTEIGSFTCKKFIISFSLSYLVTIPPFPTVPIPLLTIHDTIWIAKNNWIVKEIRPSIVLDLTKVGGATYSIPGYQKNIISETTNIVNEKNIELNFELQQNYPNPFNPTTVLNYTIPNDSKVTVEIYNTLGQRVTELVNANQNLGKHFVTWNATGYSSGTYFARFTATSLKNNKTFTDVKKLLLDSKMQHLFS